MKVKLSFIFLLVLNVSFIYSQNTNYLLIEKLNKNLSDCKAFEVKKLKITSKKFEYLEINNPEYIAIKNRIDSIKEKIVEIKNSNFNNETKKNKIADLSLLSRDLSFKISTGYSFGEDNQVREKINAYVPTTDIEREILVIDSINVSDKLKGSFITSITELNDNDDYRIMNENKLQFIKNEIVAKNLTQQFFGNDYNKLSRDLGYFYKSPIKLMDCYNLLNGKKEIETSVTSNYLIKCNENNAIYYVTNNFIEKGTIEKETYQFLKNIDELGITLSVIEDEIYIIKDGKKSILTPDIQNKIANEKDINIIEKTNSSVTMWRNLYNQQSKIAVNLSKHIQAYKSHLMTKERLAIWKKETNDCMLIQEKINKLPFNSFYKQLDTQEIQVQSAILDVMSASRNVLGI
ncbi:hypothetical protein ACM55H_05790 [Flavobacterium sp. ZT3R17]|uniref:hypothetical protein n=1 Tax=Flavobacterium cryoconiti TaxID=3398736 RepID=UPI003A890878